MTSLSDKRLEVTGVRYIGRKPKKTDNVAGTGMVWDGFGDVKKVPLHAAQILTSDKYKQIWQLESAEIPTDPTDSALQQKAAENAQAALAAHRAAVEKRTPQRQQASFDLVEPDRIIAAIGELFDGKAEDQAAHFEPNGMPKLESVNVKLGKKISPLALKEAWDIIKSAQAR